MAGVTRALATMEDMIVWRFLPDGSLDTNFGLNGMFVNNGAAGGNGEDVGRAITMDSQGRFLIAGHSENASGAREMAVWRIQ